MMIPRYIEEAVPLSPSGQFEQDGPSVYRTIKQVVPNFNRELVSNAGLTPQDIRLVIPHQGSGPIIKALEDAMPEYTIYKDIAEGNFSSASIPKAWARATKEGAIKSGDTLVLSGFGAGLYAASVLVRLG